MIRTSNIALAVVLLLLCGSLRSADEPVQVSGIYPHLAMFNEEGECGTGAVVPWAGRLWVVTYAPHKPQGSTDKLYEITPELRQTVRPESIGGTPANRMIHPESKQLFIGPYAIRSDGQVRTISYEQMFGRPTGNARHLTDPRNKIYCATMEEGLYEIDVNSLEVTELWADEQRKSGRHADLPGYHGKGLFSGQQRIVYANNGEHGDAAKSQPDVPSGVLAQWDGQADRWEIVRRNQFTEVTGPSGISGESKTDDPIWSIGWDHRSLILMCLDKGKWHSFRLPKASHSYDGAHGWNTEWPRIRDIGEDSLLMTMHGMLWKFPREFRSTHSAGISPRSSYLKVVGDFSRWQDRIVFGCDDTAKSEFLNKRKAKGTIAAPQSQSNLWFVSPNQLDQLGPTVARGAVWLKDDVAKHATSEPFLFSGFKYRSLHLAHKGGKVLKLNLEIDEAGTNIWRHLTEIELQPRSNHWQDLSDVPQATWIRITTDDEAKELTAAFSMSNGDDREANGDGMFDGLASQREYQFTGGIIRARGENKRTLQFVADDYNLTEFKELGLYELNEALQLRSVSDAASLQYQKANAAIPTGVLSNDTASLIYVDDSGRRWRIPFGYRRDANDKPVADSRVCREVATERDLFNAGGTFFELPAENAGGFSKVRAVATHNRQIVDYCSYRGLLVMSGVARGARSNNTHIIESDDGRTSLWVGAIDDVWKIGKPRGFGGPWEHTSVKAKAPSDPFLMNGYDNKALDLLHDSKNPVTFTIECDITGSGDWLPYSKIAVAPGAKAHHEFPKSYSAYWLRVTASADCVATAMFEYR